LDSRRILVIDEDKRAVDTVRAALQPYRAEIEVETDPARAYERARGAPPSAIILAVELTPQKQGYNLCRRLKKTAETKGIPVLMVSAGDPYLEDHRRLQTRAEEYLEKPFGPESLLAKLESIAGRFQRAAPSMQAEIIELEEEDVPAPEITIVSEIPEEELGDSDIAEALSVRVEPTKKPPVPPPVDSLTDLDGGEIDVDAMFEVVTQQPAQRAQATQGAPRPAAHAASASASAPSTATPPAPAATSPAPAPTPPTAEPRSTATDAELEAREREILELRERLVDAQRIAADEREQRGVIESQLTTVRTRLAAVEAANVQGSALAEELAARDREIAERTADLDRLTTDYAQRAEMAEAGFVDRLAKLRAEHDAQLKEVRQSAQRDRDELEASLYERVREAEVQHRHAAEEARASAAKQNEALRREVAELQNQVGELDLVRRDFDSQLAERIAAAADEARRPLEEQLGKEVERHTLELAGVRRELEDALAQERNRTLAAEARIPPLEARTEEAERGLSVAKAQADDAQRDLLAARTALSETIAGRGLLEQELKRLETSLATVTARAKDATMQVDAARRQVAERESRQRELETELADGQALRIRAEETVREAETRAEAARSRIAELERQVAEREATAAGTAEQLATLERERGGLEAMMHELRRQIEALADERGTLHAEIQALRERAGAQERERAALEGAKVAAEERLEAELQRGERLRQALEMLNSLMQGGPATKG
jgi:CheY-like chemotaxis protein